MVSPLPCATCYMKHSMCHTVVFVKSYFECLFFFSTGSSLKGGNREVGTAEPQLGSRAEVVVSDPGQPEAGSWLPLLAGPGLKLYSAGRAFRGSSGVLLLNLSKNVRSPAVGSANCPFRLCIVPLAIRPWLHLSCFLSWRRRRKSKIRCGRPFRIAVSGYWPVLERSAWSLFQ